MTASTRASFVAMATAALLISAPAYAAPPSGSIKTLKTIHFFPAPSLPNSLLIGSDGSFYGTTKMGGAAGYGTLYRVDPLGNFLTLHEFDGDTGAYPFLTAWGADGLLYGGSAGRNDMGAVYRIESNGDFHLLHEFTGAEDGAQPVALVAGSDGNVYGVSSPTFGNGGTGTFFRIIPDGTFAVVRHYQQTDEVSSLGGLVEQNGELYGYGGRPGFPALFHISLQGAITVLHTFPDVTGMAPNKVVWRHSSRVTPTTSMALPTARVRTSEATIG